MEKIDKHINELLYDHDCVIVPDFGGFVANYASAKIHPVQHTFTPPSKNISFNRNLKTNDGLLASRIVAIENITYPSALKHISHFVDSTNAQLKKGEKVKVDEAGVLFLDIERNIQFQQSSTNFLLDAFGLPQFQSPAIKREPIGRRIEKELTLRAPIAQERKKTSIKRYVALAIAIPFLASIIWIPLKTDLLKGISYSNLNPFATKEIKKEAIKESPKTTLVIPLVEKDTVIKVAVEQPTLPVTATLVEPVKADTTAVVKKNDVNLDFRFHLVAGCFQIENNAINFVASLQQQSISAEIIGKNKNGLFVVSCANLATYKEATKELSSLRKQLPNTWLYKN